MDNPADLPARARTSTAEIALLTAQATVAGLKSQLAVFYGSVEDRSDLAALSRTDAIFEVLRHAPATLTVDDIMSALAAGGHADEDRKTVRATLSYLEKSQRIKRTDRGRYTAA